MTMVRVLATLLAAFCSFHSVDSTERLSEPRRLKYEWLAGYEPLTLVTNYAAIDLDQAVIEKEAGKMQLDPARTIYANGGYSQSIARMRLIKPPPPIQPILGGTIVLGSAENGQVVRGFLMEQVTWTKTDEEVEILVEYEASQVQGKYLTCQVGGLVAINDAHRDGCFAPNGTIQILDLQKDVPAYHFNYTYTVRKDNFNGRTIQGFSTRAGQKMYKCDECPFPDFVKFMDYYETSDYGDKWIQAAFDGAETGFPRGNADFSAYEKAPRGEAIKVLTKFMNIWMEVVYQMEQAVVQCEKVCKNRCDDGPIREWDQAAAYYVGSQEGESGGGQGNLLYDLADTMCVHFRTCGESSSEESGTSFVNWEVIREFTKGKSFALRRDCEETKLSKEKIVRLMAVPLVQATLRMAYLRSFLPAASEDNAAKDEVAGASYAATVLPIVHHCFKPDAEIIYNNMQMAPSGDVIVDFVAVKRAFEHSYNCMGITCEQVGGVWESNKYGNYASPCRGAGKPGEVQDHNAAGMIVGVTFSVLFVFLLAVVLLYRGRHQRDASFPKQQQQEQQEEPYIPEDTMIEIRDFD